MDAGFLFPNFICRVGGISTNTFNSLRTENTYKQLKKLFNLESIINEKKEDISELLFNAIRLISDNKKRNLLLNVKRELYNNKIISNEKLNKVSKIISPNLHKHIIYYQTLLTDKQKIENWIEKSYFTEVTTIRKKFKSYLRNADFQKGLLISSNSLYKTQELYFKSSNSETNGRLEQIERGLLRYFSRMAMKATPFGTFCSVIPGKIIKSSMNETNSILTFNGNPELKRSLLQINKGLYGNIIEHCKNRNGIRKWLNLELNPTISDNTNSLMFLTAKNGQEIFQKIQNNPFIALLRNKLQELTLTSYIELTKQIASQDIIDAEENEITEYLDRLLEIGFIRFKTGISEQEINWATKLKEILIPIEDMHAKIIVDLIDQLMDKTKEFGNSDVRKREVILDVLIDGIEKSFKKMEITLDLLTELPFFEDATSNCEIEVLLNSKFYTIEESLKKYITITRRLAYPMFEQINMRHFYESKYTNLEKDVPLLKFYEDYYREHYKNLSEKQENSKKNKNEIYDDLKNFDKVNPFNLEIIKQMQNANKGIKNLIIQKWIDNPNIDEIEINSKEFGDILTNLPEAPKSYFSASLFSQLATTVSDDKEIRLILPNGKYSLGYGKYFSRFLYLFSDTQQIEIYKKDNESTDIIAAEICGDANFNANLHAPLVKWEISYPTSEGGLADHEIKTTDLFVEKHPDISTLLKLKHKPSGKYINPLDLGFLNPLMRPHLFQLLSKLTTPSSYSLSIPDKPSFDKEFKEEKTTYEKKELFNNTQVLYRPRIVFNNCIVLARKCWIVQAQVFPVILQNENDYKYFIRINRWIKQNNIPEEVYVKITVHPGKEPLEDKENKKEKKRNNKETSIIKKTEEKDKTSINNDTEDEKTQRTNKPERDSIKKFGQNKMSRDFYKPQYIDFRNPLLVNLLGKITVNLKNYTVYIEERYPQSETLPEYNGNKYTTEQIFQMNFPDNCK